MLPRNIACLKIAITGRCNLRCSYCYLGEKGDAVEKDLYSATQILRFVEAAILCGVAKVRLTGGEPLLREDAVEIASAISRAGVLDLGVTTNGTLLEPVAEKLRKAGVNAVNIGIPSLRRETYRRVTGVDALDKALAGLRAALAAGFPRVKVNVVVVKGVNDEEIEELAGLARDEPVEVRFIEVMPFAAEGLLGPEATVTGFEILERIGKIGALAPLPRERPSSPAELYSVPGFKGRVGLICPVSRPFCRSCDRVWLTADGKLRGCLVDGGEVDVAADLRERIDVGNLTRTLRRVLSLKPAEHFAGYRGRLNRIGG